jgi:tetratricopeptide (TPR) repeat protein
MENRNSITDFQVPPGAVRRPGRRKVVVLTISAIAAACLLWFAPAIAAHWTRMQASRLLKQHSPSEALHWLAWCDRFAPQQRKSGEADLLRATAFRQLNRNTDFYFEALEAGRRNGASSARLERETRLQSIESGKSEARVEQELMELITAGESAHDVCTAFIFGYLHRQDLESARRVLEAWQRDYPGDAHIAYVRGIVWRSAGDNAQAESAFHEALDKQPDHELAALALARLYEEQQLSAKALEQWLSAAKRFPFSDVVHVGLAHLLRKSGRVAQARAVLSPRQTQPTPLREVWLEASDIAFESGQYQEAAELLRAAKLAGENQIHDVVAGNVAYSLGGRSDPASISMPRIRVAAAALALGGERPLGEWAFEEVDAVHSQLQRRNDLRLFLAQDPAATEASSELDALHARLANYQNRDASGSTGTVAVHQSTALRDLYAQHCAACHGQHGDGKGPASRHLDPPARDFRHHRFRLVSARNQLPTMEDVAAVISHGIPGTSMPAFPDLGRNDRYALAKHVLQFRVQGVSELLKQADRHENSGINEAELTDLVKRQTMPESAEEIPAFGEPDASALSRGKDAFIQLGCHNCHESKMEKQEKQISRRDQLFFDENGWPTPARNLVNDPFRGGREPSSIFLRLRLGMPGTAHPACVSVPQEQLVDLVHYCRSLAKLPPTPLTNYQRSLRNCAAREANNEAQLQH